MQKFILTILSVFYLLSASGATVYNHYCMGSLVDVSTSQSQDENCGNCGMDKSQNSENGCCSDTHEFTLSDNEQQLFQGLKVQITSPVVMLSVIFLNHLYEVQPSLSSLITSADSLYPDQRPIRILHCTYRI